MTDIDDYLELLYEDTKDKLRASALILQLARNPDNLEELYQNEILVGALARVLREDWKKSTDLTTNLIYVFFCFSSFTNFHGAILHFKIGALTMTILDHEMKKYGLWTEELEKKRRDHGESSLDFKSSDDKFGVLLKKQEQLFRVAIYLLFNIAENVDVEAKMQKKGIVSILCHCLCRKNYELQILVVSFLKKLSIFKESVADMHANDVVPLLLPILNVEERELVSISLRLLYNLTFHNDLRTSMLSSGLVPVLASLLGEDYQRFICLRILYQLSRDDKAKPTIAKSGCLPSLMESVLECREEACGLEPVAIVINLACDPTAAELLGEARGIRMMMKKAFMFHDPLVMKILRNLSEHSKLKPLFLDYLPELVQAVISLDESSGTQQDKKDLLSECRNRKEPMKASLFKPGPMDDFEGDSFLDEDFGDETDEGAGSNKGEDFALECLGLLANLTLEDLDFALVLSDLNLLSWLQSKLNRGLRHFEDDLLLEMIRLIGTACLDEKAALMIANCGIGATLINLLNCKLLTASTSPVETPAYLVDLMHDKNKEIRRICDATLSLISEQDEMWARRIQAERFKWHNSQWLEMIEVTDQQSARTPLGLRESGQDFCRAYYDSEEDSENLVMAATLLEDAAGWFPSTGNKPSLGGDKGALDSPLDYFGNLGMFYPGTTEDAGGISNTATQILRHSQGDQPDNEPSILRQEF
ncbi:unnamed protein product [Schistocephalus solidus]|uniref:Kinesin-associated protein 3 n=1 Tax=Schistocephalus solidus TaxID=70667 RepID=A0A183SST6_SCHSO|nr:unnamed protein product [Schistocephalus solidus]